MARQVTVEILGNAKQYIAATEEANLASTRLGGGLGKAGGAAKNLEKDLTGMSKSAAGGIPILGSLGGTMGGLPLPALAAAAAIGLIFVAGKSILGISEKWVAAQKGLAQATDSAGASYADAKTEVDSFIASNKKFITNQAEVVDSFAALTRQLGPTGFVVKDLNLALDLSAIKHISLKDATTALQQAEAGRGRALVTLGINMKDYPVLAESQFQADKKLEAATLAVQKATLAHTAALHAHGIKSAQAKATADALKLATAKLAEAHNYAKERAAASAEIHDLLEKKLAGGRKTTSELTQKQNELGNAWQSFSQRTGPVLINVLEFIADKFLTILNIIIDVIGRIGDLIGWISKIDVTKIPVLGGLLNAFSGSGAKNAGGRGITGKAGGGPVSPGNVYAVGEAGPEIFAPSVPGTIIPHGAMGSRTSVTINLYATIADGPALDRFTNDIAQRLRYASGV